MRETESRYPVDAYAATVPDASPTEIIGQRIQLADVVELSGARMIGRVLAGRYRIEELLAQGAMGRVYTATQLRLNRLVAVKVMTLVGDPRFAMRFCREASIASQLAHPNIVSVYDYGETERGELFMVMEHCAGRPMHEVLFHEAPFSADRTLSIAIQIARALRKAHAQGVVHRDLKPANIILAGDEDGSDFVKVLDFGLVKLFAPEDCELAAHFADDHLTRPGNMVGTPEYVSPEQALGDAVDGRADIYSLGVLMFQMISGKLPYTGATLLETVRKHFQLPVPRIAEMAPGIECPPELEAIIRRCMEKARDDRFASMDELLVALKAAWRNITDESYGTETALPSLQMLREEETPSALPAVDHEPGSLENADVLLPVVHVHAPDPSEFQGRIETTAKIVHRDRSREWMRAIGFVLLLVALGSGSFWFSAQYPGAQREAPKPVVVLPAPVVQIARDPEPKIERTIEPVEKPAPAPAKRPHKTKHKKAREFKDNPY